MRVIRYDSGAGPRYELGRLEYEGELAVVLSRTARDVRRDDFASYVLGHTCANDVIGTLTNSVGARAPTVASLSPARPERQGESS